MNEGKAKLLTDADQISEQAAEIQKQLRGNADQLILRI